MRLKLDPETVANLELLPDQAEQFFWDTNVSGFALRLRKGGHRTWIIQYRYQGRTRRMVIGDAAKVRTAQAREQARKELAKAELGADPAADRRKRREKDAMILRAVIADYLDHKTGIKPASMRSLRHFLLGPCGGRARQQGLEPFLKPLLARPIDTITRRDISMRLLQVSKKPGAASALGLNAALSSLFSWAMQMGLVEHSPVVNSFRPPKPPTRDRALSGEELAAVWRALDGVQGDYAAIVKLLICTGGRRQEIGGMKQSEVSPDMTSWTLPATRSKNHKEHKLPLTPLMVGIIKSVPMREGNDYFFGKKGFTVWSNCKKALDEQLNLEPWTHHDLRRSVATGMNDIGIAPHIVEEILNHQSGHRRGPAGIYNRSVYANEVAAALARWSEHVAAITEGRASKVIPMIRA
jgi:integrase